MSLDKIYTDSAICDNFKEFFNQFKNDNEEYFYVDTIDELITTDHIVEIDFEDFTDILKNICNTNTEIRIHTAIYRAIKEVFQTRHSSDVDNFVEKNYIKFKIVNSDKFKDIIFDDPKQNSLGNAPKKIHFHATNGNTTTIKEVLNYKIRTLRPITYFRSDNTKMILVYLPTKKVIEKTKTVGDDIETISTDIQWINSAYFLISKLNTNGTQKREILPFDHESLEENYRINILSEWNDVRWNITDCKSWLQESGITENPKELYQLLDKTAKTYLEYDETEYTKFNLWGIATYFYDLFTAFPYYDFTGTKRAGKTKSLEFQNHTCYNAIMSPDVTGSSLFRIIEGIGATVLLDETEEFKNKKNGQAQTVRNLLMQAFLKDQYAIRSDATKDKSFTPTQYNIYSPKSLAHINSFDDVLEDRCLRHTMKRGLNETIKNTWVSEKDPAFQVIRNKCYRLFLDHADQIYDLQQEARTTLGISGRELQLWTPIMTLALFFEKFGVNGLVDAILNSMKKSKEDRQLSDEEESRDLKVLDYLSSFGIELALNEKNDKAHNSPGWIAIGLLYNNFSLIMEETYQINKEYFTRRTLSQTLDRFGFKKEKKQDGISFLIIDSTVNEAKQRMGISEYNESPTSDSDKITSFTSETSDSYLDIPKITKNESFRNDVKISETSENNIQTSDNNSNGRRKSEQNEVNEQNEVKIDKQNNSDTSKQDTPPSPTLQGVEITCDRCSTVYKNTTLPLEFMQKRHSENNPGHTLYIVGKEDLPVNLPEGDTREKMEVKEQ